MNYKRDPNSINEPTNIPEFGFDVYPSPSTGAFTISANGYFSNSDIKLYTANGKLLKKVSNFTGKSIDFDIDYAGVLLIEDSFTDGSKKLEKLILN